MKTIKIDSNLQDMVISAVRYAIGRKTYITGQTVDFIINNPDLIDNRVKKILLKDLSYYFDNRKELFKDDEIDYISWKRLNKFLLNFKR